jgi:hypothetical protein
MTSIITESLAKSYSYQEYRTLVHELIENGKSTGNIQSEEMLKYSELNDARMKRLDKTVEILPEVKSFLETVNSPFIWLVISEGWCGDAAQIVPVIHKMANESANIEMRIVLRDENEDLMNLFLTNGAKSIPKLLIVDKNNLEVIADFGPRPTGASQLIIDYKAQHGVVDEPAKIALQKWYLDDKSASIQNEIIAVFNQAIVAQNL